MRKVLPGSESRSGFRLPAQIFLFIFTSTSSHLFTHPALAGRGGRGQSHGEGRVPPRANHQVVTTHVEWMLAQLESLDRDHAHSGTDMQALDRKVRGCEPAGPPGRGVAALRSPPSSAESSHTCMQRLQPPDNREKK